MKLRKEFLVQSPQTFFHNLVSFICSAGKGDIIWIQSFVFEPGNPGLYLEQIVAALLQAKSQGAMVYLLIDSFGILTTREVPIKSPFLSQKSYKKILEIEGEKKILLAKMQQSGIIVKTTGSVSSIKRIFPWIACNHRKSYGFLSKNKNIHVAWVTGINMANPSFVHFDLALKIMDTKLVEILYEQFMNDYSQKDQSFNKRVMISDKITYFKENNGFSSIYQEANKLIGEAQSFIRIAAQYPIDPFLAAKLIKKSNQGVDIQVLMSQKSDISYTQFPFNLLYNYTDMKLRKYSSIQRKYYPEKVHAKLIYSEKEALIGSDNISLILKLLQTKEDMLCIKEKDIIFNINKQFQTAWAKSKKI